MNIVYLSTKVDFTSSKIVGVEALIRWISPTKGFITPNVLFLWLKWFIKRVRNWIVESFKSTLKMERNGN